MMKSCLKLFSQRFTPFWGLVNRFFFNAKVFLRDSEFSSCEIELQNGITQNDVTLGVINSKIIYRNSSF